MAGTAVTMTGTFKTSSGDFVDPTNVRLLYKPSGGAVTVKSTTAAELTHPSTGVYTFWVATLTSQVGEWAYRFEGTGAAVAAGENEFSVLQPQVST